MRRSERNFTRGLVRGLAAGLLIATTAAAASAQVVISQVYGGGGNSGATLKNDFIELHNNGTSAQSLDGWSIQYASSTGTSWSRLNLAGSIAPGGYYLIQMAQGAGGTVNLPTPDATGTVAMSGSAGKVALLASTTTATGTCAVGAVDSVSYGSGSTACETTQAPGLTNATAALRAGDGCTDTNNNGADFTAATPAPRNSASALNACSGAPQVTLSINDVSIGEGNSGTVTATFTVSLSSSSHAGVSFDIATSDNTATTLDNDYVAHSETGVLIAPGDDSYTFDVTINGDTVLEADETFFVNVANATGALVLDGQGTGRISNDEVPPPVVTDVVISQVYGGGGNNGATLTHDFVELFNPGANPVDLIGWSLQYNSTSGTNAWQVTPLSGSIAPGGYFLVRFAAGGGGTVALPAHDATGTTNLSGTSGKVALQTSTTAIVGACPAGSTADLVGYGSTASTNNFCFEGAGPTAQLGASTAALRKRGGCYDTDNNSADFSVTSPQPRNSASPTRSCTPVPVTISQIQGAGLASPLAGQDVSTTGIVTARKSNGFFMQTPDASIDADAQTSEGIFVFTSVAPVAAVGDAVGVVGTATEFFNLTQIDASLPGDVSVITSGNPLPAPVTLTTAILDPAGTPTQLERFEGMRMFAPSLTSVAPTSGFGETSTVLTGVPRPMREPGIQVSDPVPVDPTSGLIDCCIPRFDENPERIVVDTDGLIGTTPLTVTSNVIFGSITGPLDYTFSAYKLLPEVTPTVTASMIGVPVPVPGAGEYTIGGFNIENFNGDVTRTQKAALAIRTLMRSPDIVGVIEISNLAALQGLATQINTDAVAAGEPNPEYDARLELAPTAGGGFSSQNVGFLVKTSRVRIDSVSQEPSGTYINPLTGLAELLHDRPPYILRATVDVNGPNPHPVVVVVNHLRSFIDVELEGGEGLRVRAKRKAQAESLAQLLQDLQAELPSKAVVSLGDYNAYQFNDGYSDPIATIVGAPRSDDEVVVDASPDLVSPNYINLTDSLPAAEQYSFVFEGTPQALDHIIVNTVGNGFVQRYAIARGNADFPEGALETDSSRPERASDHDMPVAFLRFPDVTPPTIDSIADITAPATQPGGATVTFATSATDNTDGALPVTCSPASGSLFAVGTTPVTCSATDAAGNSVSTSFTVTVTTGTPRLVAQVVGKTSGATTMTIDVRFTNTGTGSAVDVVVDGVIFRTVAGTGVVTLSTPTIPMALGLITPGQSVTRTLSLTTGAVTRFAITENGSLKTAAGSPLRFSSSQAVIK